MSLYNIIDVEEVPTTNLISHEDIMNLGHDDGNDSDDSFACDSEDENDKTLEENDVVEQEVYAQQTNLTPKVSVDGMLFSFNIL